MMSIKTVNALSHYTDWTIGHVHSGALGWVAMITVGSPVCAAFRGCSAGRRCAACDCMDVHFWIATIGIVLYVTSMWIAGVMQGLMWRATERRRHADLHVRRIAESDLSLLRGAPARRPDVPQRHADHGLQRAAHGSRCAKPGRTCAVIRRERARMSHEIVEKKVGLMGALIAVVISIGGLVEIVPLYCAAVRDRARRPAIKPYSRARSSRGATSTSAKVATTATRRWCGRCRAETERYGHYSLAGEAVYDHPFQFGSKRTGPGPGARRRTLQRRMASRAPDRIRATSCRNRTCPAFRGSRRTSSTVS